MYRWWTLAAWWEWRRSIGVKLGPVSLDLYWWDGLMPCFYAGLLCRWWLDTGLYAHGGRLIGAASHRFTGDE